MTDNEPPAKRVRTEVVVNDTAVLVSTKDNAATINDDDDDDDDDDAKKEMLMPPTPRDPPMAPPKEKPIGADKGRWWKSRLGMTPPEVVYGPSDTALWPDDAAELYRAIKTTKDPKSASRYMRWWFHNHEGMPGRVPKIPRSAYSMYYVEQKHAVFVKNGKFNAKKDGKKIGVAWKVLSEQRQQLYVDNYVTQQAERDNNTEWWNNRMTVWREERQKRLLQSLEENNNNTSGLAPFCDCSKCVVSA